MVRASRALIADNLAAVTGPDAIADREDAAGIAAFLAWSSRRIGLGAGRSAFGISGTFFLAVGGLFCVLSWDHQGDFRDLDTLWSRTVEKSPRAWMAWTNLGILRSDQGRQILDFQVIAAVA